MGRFLKWLAVSNTAILLVAAPVSWLAGLDYDVLLTWSGLIVLVAGSLAASAGAGLPRGVSPVYREPLPCCNCGFVPKGRHELHRSYDLCLLAGAVGFTAIGAGMLLNQIRQ